MRPSPFFLSRQLTATFTFYAQDFTRFTARGLRARRGLQTPAVRETRPGRALKNSFLPANGVNLVNFTASWTVDEK